MANNLGEQGRVRIRTGQMDPDTPHRHFDLSSNLEKLGANRVTASLSQIGTCQSETTQLMEQNVGDGGKP